ncbi:MAG: HPF/RaiA family ribosome-associated protein [Blastocatellia bacterium]
METPLQIAFHNVSHSAWIEGLVLRAATRLESFYSSITACRVVVDRPHKNHEHGNKCTVKIDITVPGREIVVSRDASLHRSLADLQEDECSKRLETGAAGKRIEVAVQGAFDAARRQLQDYSRRQRGEVKSHSK